MTKAGIFVSFRDVSSFRMFVNTIRPYENGGRIRNETKRTV